MPDQPKQAKAIADMEGGIALDPEGRYQLVTTGPVSEQVVQHLSAMLREWRAAGQTFRVDITSNAAKKG